MLHYVLPQPPREGVRFVACVGVIVGYNNRMRVFSVFEREIVDQPQGCLTVSDAKRAVATAASEA